jgi:hypothetical protein
LIMVVWYQRHAAISPASAAAKFSTETSIYPRLRRTMRGPTDARNAGPRARNMTVLLKMIRITIAEAIAATLSLGSVPTRPRSTPWLEPQTRNVQASPAELEGKAPRAPPCMFAFQQISKAHRRDRSRPRPPPSLAIPALES